MSRPGEYVVVIRKNGDVSTGKIITRLQDGWVIIDDGGVRFKAEAITVYKQLEPSLGGSQ